MPKRNADFRAKPKGLCIFIKPLNLMDLALEQKRKSKTKRFRYVLSEKQTLVCSRVPYSAALKKSVTNHKQSWFFNSYF